MNFVIIFLLKTVRYIVEFPGMPNLASLLGIISSEICHQMQKESSLRTGQTCSTHSKVSLKGVFYCMFFLFQHCDCCYLHFWYSANSILCFCNILSFTNAATDTLHGYCRLFLFLAPGLFFDFL